MLCSVCLTGLLGSAAGLGPTPLRSQRLKKCLPSQARTYSDLTDSHLNSVERAFINCCGWYPERLVY